MTRQQKRNEKRARVRELQIRTLEDAIKSAELHPLEGETDRLKAAFIYGYISLPGLTVSISDSDLEHRESFYR